MASRLLCLALLVLFLTGTCCKPVAYPDPIVDRRTSAEKAEAKSVAILSSGGRAKCGGVWVGQASILTAGHCVTPHRYPWDNSTPVMEGLLVLYETEFEGVAHNGYVVRYSEELDLALIATPWGETPPHEYAKLGASPRDGDELDIVGSMGGLAFTYSRGVVAATREAGYDDDPKAFKVIEVTGPVFFGNSGGGAFDSWGNLVGIADYIRPCPSGIGDVHGIVWS